MSETPDNPDSVSPKPSWDASQVNIRPWLEDLFPWLQSKNPSYAPLIERGYALTSQGRVAVTSAEHAEHVFFRLDQSYTFESPSPINPHFSAAQSTPTDGGSVGPAGGTRSGATTAAPAAAPASDPNRPPRPLTADE
eukprot:2008-Pleurochrysis_carterae.AAC.1